jgi:4'-phosphopantetheinyl transferase EntD
MKLRAELRALFPPGAAGAELACLDAADPLLPEEQAGLAASARRLREFRAGRHCAREALAALGEPPRALPRGPDRQPAWPAGIVGSISHTRGWCGAVVARRASCGGIGLDAEEWGRVGAKLWPRIATAAERAWLAARGAEAERLATVLFSAKEAFFKAQFPASGCGVGFQDAACHLLDPAAGAFEIELLRDLAGVGAAGARFPGRFASCAERCYTGVALPPRPGLGPLRSCARA